MSYFLRILVSSFKSRWTERANLIEKNNLRKQINAVISASATPNTGRAESDFSELMVNYSGPGEYGYDRRSMWLRGLERADQIAKLVPSLNVGSRVCEVGCGDGFAAYHLSSMGADICLTDLRDWRDSQAHGLNFVAFDLASEEPLPFAGEQDLIYSFNAFEHFPNPKSVLSRMCAKLRSGGFLFFEFGPLYAGPWGLHAYRMLPMPYPQFLFGEGFWREKLKGTGIRDLGQNLDDIQPLNRWTIRQFDELWASSGCRIIHSRRFLIDSHLDVVLKYPEAFQGRGLSYDDLTTQGVSVLLQKIK